MNQGKHRAADDGDGGGGGGYDYGDNDDDDDVVVVVVVVVTEVHGCGITYCSLIQLAKKVCGGDRGSLGKLEHPCCPVSAENESCEHRIHD